MLCRTQLEGKWMWKRLRIYVYIQGSKPLPQLSLLHFVFNYLLLLEANLSFLI